MGTRRLPSAWQPDSVSAKPSQMAAFALWQPRLKNEGNSVVFEA